jgi:hypothetical protein
MNVTSFKSTLQEVLDSEVANLKLYATTKQGHTKKVSISDEVSDSLFELFKNNITDMFLNEEKKYRLKPIEQSSEEEAKAYYYFTSETIYEKLEKLYGFNCVQNEEIFNFEETNLNDIETFYISIATEAKSITLYKKNYPINLLKRGKTLFFTKSSTSIDEFKNDILKIDQSFQFIACDEHVVIANLSMLEKQLGYDTVITQKAREIVNTIASLGFLEDIVKLQEMTDSTRIAKKLNLIKESQVFSVIQTDVEKVKIFISKIEDLKKSLKFNSENKLQVNSKIGVEKFLKLLDDDYLKSELTENVYDSLNKEKV